MIHNQAKLSHSSQPRKKDKKEKSESQMIMNIINIAKKEQSELVDNGEQRKQDKTLKVGDIYIFLAIVRLNWLWVYYYYYYYYSTTYHYYYYYTPFI